MSTQIMLSVKREDCYVAEFDGLVNPNDKGYANYTVRVDGDAGNGQLVGIIARVMHSGSSPRVAYFTGVIKVGDLVTRFDTRTLRDAKAKAISTARGLLWAA